MRLQINEMQGAGEWGVVVFNSNRTHQSLSLLRVFLFSFYLLSSFLLPPRLTFSTSSCVLLSFHLISTYPTPIPVPLAHCTSTFFTSLPPYSPSAYSLTCASFLSYIFNLNQTIHKDYLCFSSSIFCGQSPHQLLLLPLSK